MDAWATVSHYLDYKTDADVPLGLRKDFQALSGLFYLADTHFEMFYGATGRSQQETKDLFIEKPSLAATAAAQSGYTIGFPDKEVSRPRTLKTVGTPG